jgi:putative transposase
MGEMGIRPLLFPNPWSNYKMPRLARVAVGGIPYHVINRSNGRVQIFNKDKDYQHFESLLLEGVELIDMRILAYCIMPNHWHLVLYPKQDTDLSEFMRWVTTTHVRQRRTQTKSVGEGHLYQGTYKSFPIETDQHLTTVIRYVEQNPLRAKLVTSAEEWKWSSLFRRERGSREDLKLLAKLPTELPSNYQESVNELLHKEDLDFLRYSVTKGAPYGSTVWTDEMVERYNLGSTLRGPGRPKQS